MNHSLNSYYKELWGLPGLKRLTFYYVVVAALSYLLTLLGRPSNIIFPLIILLSAPLMGYALIKLEKFTPFKRILGFLLFFNLSLLIACATYIFLPIYSIEVGLIILIYLLVLGSIAFYYISVFKKIIRLFALNLIIIPYILYYNLITVKNFINFFNEFIRSYAIFLITFASLELYLFMLSLAIKRKYKIDLMEHFRAFLLTWLSKERKYFENILSKSQLKKRNFRFPIIAFRAKDGRRIALFSLPIHPGPFLTTGSSDLPSLLMNKNSITVLPFHGFSTHKQDMVSSEEKELLINLIEKEVLREKNYKDLLCTRMRIFESENFEIKAFLLNELPILIIAQKQAGVVDDIEEDVYQDIRKGALEEGFEDVILIDAHNACSEHVNWNDHLKMELIENAKKALHVLRNETPEHCKLGIQRIKFEDYEGLQREICPGGGIMLAVGNEKFMNCLILIDSNNINQLLRRKIVNEFKRIGVLCEVCSTDSHYKTAALTGDTGYHPFGSDLKSHDKIIKSLLDEFEKIRGNMIESQVSNSNFNTPEFRVLDNLIEIYEKGTREFVKFGKIIPYIAFSFSLLSFFILTTFIAYLP